MSPESIYRARKRTTIITCKCSWNRMGRICAMAADALGEAGRGRRDYGVSGVRIVSGVLLDGTRSLAGAESRLVSDGGRPACRGWRVAGRGLASAVVVHRPPLSDRPRTGDALEAKINCRELGCRSTKPTRPPLASRFSNVRPPPADLLPAIDERPFRPTRFAPPTLISFIKKPPKASMTIFVSIILQNRNC